MAESSKNIFDFRAPGNARSVLEKWAEQYHFHIRELEGGGLECQRGGGMMMCPIIVQMKQKGDEVHLEIYLKVDLLTQFTTLFMAPERSAIDSSVEGLWRERALARDLVNPLLEALKQPKLN